MNQLPYRGNIVTRNLVAQRKNLYAPNQLLGMRTPFKPLGRAPRLQCVMKMLEIDT